MSRSPLLTVAPRFHLPAEWPQRLEVRREGDWRAASGDEVAALVAPAAPLEADLPADRVALIVLPSHLRDSWWRAAEHVDSGAPGGAHYQRFVQELVDFFTFKRLPLPESCSSTYASATPAWPRRVARAASRPT